MKRIVESKEEVISRENVYYWMNKYISLLEKYNELLLEQSFKDLEDNESGQASTRSLPSVHSSRRSKQKVSNDE